MIEKYKGFIHEIGKKALDFVGQNFIILLGNFPHIAENDVSVYAHIVTLPTNKLSIQVNDVMHFGSHAFTVTAVGAEASANFSLMGHVTVRFDGKNTAELPGSIHLEGLLPTLDIGDVVMIRRNL